MKLKFTYKLRDLCFGMVCLEDQRIQEEDVIDQKVFKLSPCQKQMKMIITNDKLIQLVFPHEKKLNITSEGVHFTYEEFYELFEDSRYYELEGTIQLLKE